MPRRREELPALSYNDILDGLTWLDTNLAGVLVMDSSGHALIPVLPVDVFGMGISEVCEAEPLA